MTLNKLASTKLKKTILVVIFVAVYLNIGWGLGYYWYNNIVNHDFKSASFTAKIMAGHCFLFKSAGVQKEKDDFESWVVFPLISWPFILLFFWSHGLYIWFGGALCG